jgi:hypothetical protein
MAQAGSSPESMRGALACLDVMELAGWLAQQHAQELKEVLRLPGDRANQARTQLQALAQLLHNTLCTSSSGDGEERGSDGAMAMAVEADACTSEKVRLSPTGGPGGRGALQILSFEALLLPTYGLGPEQECIAADL